MANNLTNVQHPQLHISSNPDESLNELFTCSLSSSLHGSPMPSSLPYAQRKLPASFFTPPSQCSSATHSRESSLDATFSPRPHLNSTGKPPTPIALNSPLSSSPASPPNAQLQQQQRAAAAAQANILSVGGKATPPVPVSGRAVFHSRARSLPVSLSNNFSLPNNTIGNGANQNVPPNQQQRQQMHSPQQLPHSLPQSPQVKAMQNAHFRQHSYDINKMQLPEGWSMSFTANGDRYFLNHKEKITTWEDPRKELLRRELCNSNPNSIASVAARQMNNAVVPSYSSQPNMQQVLQQQQFAESKVIDPANVPLPAGWKQTTTPNGDVYYVNMNDQSTSWYHPAIQRPLQLKLVQQKQQSSGLSPPTFLQTIQAQQANGNAIPPELLAALENMTTESAVSSPGEMMQQMQPQTMATSQNVRDLELERERMRQRQEEILQSSLMKNANYLAFATQPAADPFLTSVDASFGGSNGGGHARQESLDSGLSSGSSMTNSHLTLNSCVIGASNNNGFGSDQMLGGHTLNNGHAVALATSFSSPDELLNTMDQFANGQQGAHGRVGQQQQTTLGNQSMPGNDDLSFIDSIDLMPNIDMDILSDVEELLGNNRDNIMTWL